MASASTGEVTFQYGSSFGDEGTFADIGFIMAFESFEEYTGWEIVEVGVRDLQLEIFEPAALTFGWAMTSDSMGGVSSLFFPLALQEWAEPGNMFIPEVALAMQGNGMEVIAIDTGFPGNLGGSIYASESIGSMNESIGGAFNVISSEWYYVLSPTPAPGALALLGLGGLVGTSRRRRL